MKEGKAYIGDEIVEGNEVIALFMGAEWCEDDYGEWGYKGNFPGPFQYRAKDNLKYHSSWDWLMPVWYKFRLLDAPTGLECELLNLIGRLAQDLAYEEITIFHKNLVLAITWYNQNKQS